METKANLKYLSKVDFIPKDDKELILKTAVDTVGQKTDSFTDADKISTKKIDLEKHKGKLDGLLGALSNNLSRENIDSMKELCGSTKVSEADAVNCLVNIIKKDINPKIKEEKTTNKKDKKVVLATKIKGFKTALKFSKSNDKNKLEIKIKGFETALKFTK